jgi:hypothetical protein
MESFMLSRASGTMNVKVMHRLGWPPIAGMEQVARVLSAAGSPVDQG